MSSTTLPVCPKTGSTSPSLTVHLCLHTVPGNRECALFHNETTETASTIRFTWVTPGSGRSALIDYQLEVFV